MNTSIKNILQNNDFSKDDIIELLYANQSETKFLYQKAKEVKSGQIGDKVYLRGLIEFSNLCAKDCFYCGIGKSNKNVQRYSLSDREIIQAAQFAFDEHYGSIVLQSGEVKSREFENRVDRLLKQIRKITGNNFGITLSCGEQKESTYSRWFESGANRYLLRIETSNKELYKQIHPNNSLHSFQKRIDSLRVLKNIGYQVGTGVMVGLPGQTLSHIADDILFMKDIDIDMCGVGPYIEHHETPLDNNGSPKHIFKYQVLEQYEDVLDNLQEYDGALPENLPLKYLYKPEENSLETTLDLFAPFNNKISYGQPTQQGFIDMVETYNYLQGYFIKSIKTYELNKKYYKAVETTIGVLVIWRDIAIDEDDSKQIIELALKYPNIHTIEVNAEFATLQLDKGNHLKVNNTDIELKIITKEVFNQ